MQVFTELPMITVKAMDSELLSTRLFRNYWKMQEFHTSKVSRLQERVDGPGLNRSSFLQKSYFLS